MATSLKSYFDNIKETATSIFEGMSVTMSYMFRRPATVQYPDRIPKPVHEMLPARYRGFLEVDTEICTACLACERACPIDCIRIDAEKDKETRRLVMARFDIDLAKCMYCGLCSEPCPTGAITHTPHFEASTAHVENLVFRFVPQDASVEAFKPIKGYDAPRRRRGEVLEAMGVVHTAARARAFKPPPLDLPRLPAPAVPPKKPRTTPLDLPVAQASKLAPRAVGLDRPGLAVLLEESMAGTDCALCDWPTCKQYAEALAFGRDEAPHKCEPGGVTAKLEAEMILRSWRAGRVVPEALGPAEAGAVVEASAAPGAEPGAEPEAAAPEALTPSA